MAVIAQFLLTLILLVGGIFLVGIAQDAPSFNALIFIGGILSICLAFFIPMTVARRGMR
ncbi:hypothetical protein [Microbacterium sp. MYb66]|uniref:hypothetical protein n=1 Tax=Microbacterium sp. MYb66 TaxID=1848692 RepID=UPI0015E35915|nr:hypothetical protein [Microbacterium sp. MYb66]